MLPPLHLHLSTKPATRLDFLGSSKTMTLIGLPFTGYADCLTSVGLKAHFDAFKNASLNNLALYIAFTIGYTFAKRNGDNALSCGILSLLSFLITPRQD